MTEYLSYFNIYIRYYVLVPALVDALIAATVPRAVAHDRDAEARSNAASSIGRIVETLRCADASPPYNGGALSTLAVRYFLMEPITESFTYLIMYYLIMIFFSRHHSCTASPTRSSHASMTTRRIVRATSDRGCDLQRLVRLNA